MKKYILKTCLVFALLYSNVFYAQNIQLKNPSFEGEPLISHLPEGWQSRGTPGYSKPDTQPNDTFEVSKPAKDGNTYVGIVTRADDSFEAITQGLERPLKAGEHYEVSCYLARSDSYFSGTLQNRHLKEQHTQPIKLKVLGANALIGDSTVLDESPKVHHTAWEKYTFELTPKEDYHYIVFQASWITPSLVSYIGNILIDDCSVIKCLTCEEEEEEEEIIVEVEEKEEKEEVIEAPEEETVVTPQPNSNQHGTTTDHVNKTPKDSTEVAVTSPEPEPEPEPEPKPEPEDTIKVGDVFKYETINFEKNLANLTDDSTQSLNEIFNFLYQNYNYIVEIGGHTNLRGGYSYSEELSQRRAESVMRYLVAKGINKERMSAKGYGKEHPEVPDEKNLEDRRKNQRVEIKILSIGK